MREIRQIENNRNVSGSLNCKIFITIIIIIIILIIKLLFLLLLLFTHLDYLQKLSTSAPLIRETTNQTTSISAN